MYHKTLILCKPLYHAVIVKSIDTFRSCAVRRSNFAFFSSPVLIITLIGLIVLLYCDTSPAYGHITKQFGPIKVEVGWSNEPSLAGELNNVIVGVNKTTSAGNSTAVINALANVNIVLKYGGVTKQLDFEPSEQAEGLFQAKLIPTRIGSYSLVLNGTIQGQKIANAEIPLDEVEGKQKLSFPDSSNTEATNTNTNIGSNVQGILSQLANDIDSTKSSLDTLAKNDANTQKSIQDLKNSNDRAYMIGMTGIGAGIAGIVIAALALSNKRAVVDVRK
jgi:hypothetical protein